MGVAGEEVQLGQGNVADFLQVQLNTRDVRLGFIKTSPGQDFKMARMLMSEDWTISVRHRLPFLDQSCGDCLAGVAGRSARCLLQITDEKGRGLFQDQQSSTVRPDRASRYRYCGHLKIQSSHSHSEAHLQDSRRRRRGPPPPRSSKWMVSDHQRLSYTSHGHC